MRRNGPAASSESSSLSADRKLATIAFAQYSSSALDNMAASARQLTPISRLDPDSILLFRAPPHTSEARLQDILGVRPLLPSRHLMHLQEPVALLAEHPATVMAIQIDRLETGRGADTVNRESLTDKVFTMLDQTPADAPLILALPATVADLAESDQWQTVHEMLAGEVRQTTVIVGLSDTFSTWVQDGVRYISIAELLPGKPAEMDKSAGRFPGLLWGRIALASAPAFNVINLDGFMEMADVQRHDQLTYSRLAATLHATPLDSFEPVTTVRLRNTTDIPLDFSARWSFQESEVEVIPQIMGFQLQPGEDYEQQFRFQHASQRSLKSMRPTLALQTSFGRANGDIKPVTLKVSPWCRVAGVLSILKEPIVLDGVIEEWSASEYTLDQAVQVVGDPASRRGPQDAAATLQFGWQEDNLYIGLRISDDVVLGAVGGPRIGHENVKVYLYSDDAGEEEAGDEAPKLHAVTVWSNGEYEFTRNHEEVTNPTAAVANDPDGYSVEMQIPRTFYSSQPNDGTVRVEVVLTDTDQVGGDVKQMIFSGRLNSRGQPVPELFARFMHDGEESAGKDDVPE